MAVNSPTRTPHPARVAGGAMGSRRRWDADAIRNGREPGPRRVRLDDLTTEQRHLIIALVEAAKASNASADKE
jgi:hypothetical protein